MDIRLVADKKGTASTELAERPPNVRLSLVKGNFGPDADVVLLVTRPVMRLAGGRIAVPERDVVYQLKVTGAKPGATATVRVGEVPV